MIEVEVNCKLTKEQEEALTRDVVFISEEKITDIYYDTQDYQLAQKDIRLRTRNGKFMLKVPMDDFEHLTNQIKIPKKEIAEETMIIDLLNLPDLPTLAQAIKRAGYTPRFTVNKLRKKYHADNIVIDIDHIQRDGGIFRKAEIEIVVKSQDEIESAMKKIINFAQQHGIEVDKTKQSFIEVIKGNLLKE